MADVLRVTCYRKPYNKVAPTSAGHSRVPSLMYYLVPSL